MRSEKKGQFCVMKVHRFRKEKRAAEMLICARENNSEERNKS